MDVAIAQMSKDVAQRGYVDVHKWFYFLANDIISELTFGKSSGTLESVQVTFDSRLPTKPATSLA